MSDTTLSTSETFASTAAAASGPVRERWSAGKSFRFVVFTSIALWAAIVTVVVSLI